MHLPNNNMMDPARRPHCGGVRRPLRRHAPRPRFARLVSTTTSFTVLLLLALTIGGRARADASSGGSSSSSSLYSRHRIPLLPAKYLTRKPMDHKRTIFEQHQAYRSKYLKCRSPIDCRGGEGGKGAAALKQEVATKKEQRTNLLPIHTSAKGKHNDNRPDDDPKVLMLIRVLFFCYYASLGSLLPYLPVYYHSLGHGGQIIGMLGAIKPFTTFLVAPLWGVVSDQTGSPFTVLYFTFLVSLLGQLMVAWRHDYTWIMIMVFLTAFFNAPVKSLLDSMVMSNLQDRSRYGRLRLWGQLGFGVGSSCVGYLLSQSRHEHVPYTPWKEGTTMCQHLDDVWQTITGYKLLYFSYMVLSVPSFVCIRAFDRTTREKQATAGTTKITAGTKPTPTKNTAFSSKSNNRTETRPSVWDGIRVLFHNSDALLFFFLVLVVGISSGVIENFAYVRIREVGGTGKEMGLCRLVSSLAGAPMFWYSGTLTEWLGADRVIVVGLVNYVVRYFNYALIQSPLQALPAEALRGMTFAAFWSTCTIYATRIAPPGMQATMLMFLNAMYGGLGQSLGAIIGGKLQSKVGTVWTFLFAGLFDSLFVGLVIAYLSVRKDSSFKNPQPIGGKHK